MKGKILLAMFFVCTLNITSGQSEKKKHDIEKEVRKLDRLHAASVLSGDLNEMDKYWTKDFMVTNPFNEIDRADRIRNGAVSYGSFQTNKRICSGAQKNRNSNGKGNCSAERQITRCRQNHSSPLH